MRIAVLGTGAVGGTIAALLARAGHDVEVTARGENLAALRRDGLRLDGAWGSSDSPVTALERLSRAPELAFVTTKVQDAQSVMTDNAQFLAGIPVVVVQNGLRSIETAERTLPSSRIVGALALYAASHVAAGRVSVTTAGLTYLGTPHPGSREAVLRAAEVLGAVMPVAIAEDFTGAQWTKLLVNQINALPAITGLSAQEVTGNQQLRLLLTRSMREAVRAAIAGGVRFGGLQGLTDRRLRLFVRAPLWIGQVLPELMSRRMGATPNPGSTLQSIRHGRSTEIDYLNGAVVEAGRRAGVPTAVNRALVDLVHEVEAGHGFLSPDEVLSRVALRQAQGKPSRGPGRFSRSRRTRGAGGPGRCCR